MRTHHDDLSVVSRTSRLHGETRFDRYGLIRHEYRLDADGQIGLDLGHRPLNILTQGKNVSAFPHGDGKADRLLAVDAEHGLRRIRVTAPNLRDVAEAQNPPADNEVDVQYILFGLKRAGHSQ